MTFSFLFFSWTRRRRSDEMCFAKGGTCPAGRPRDGASTALPDRQRKSAHLYTAIRVRHPAKLENHLFLCCGFENKKAVPHMLAGRAKKGDATLSH